MASKFSHPGLEAMGYKFNDNLEIRQIENGEPFAWQGQAHYDRLVCNEFSRVHDAPRLLHEHVIWYQWTRFLSLVDQC